MHSNRDDNDGMACEQRHGIDNGISMATERKMEEVRSERVWKESIH